MENYNPLHHNSVRELVHYAAEKYGDRDFLRYYQDSQIKGITFHELKDSVRMQTACTHLMVYEDKNGFSYELRFWENRLDAKLIGIFMKVYEAIVRGMIRTDTVKGLRNYIPKKYLVKQKTILIGTEKHEVTILNRYDQIQPVGGWGKLYMDGTNTGRIARLNWEDKIDYLEDSGRMVFQEITAASFYVNLNSLQKSFEAYEGVERAEIYCCYGEQNRFYLTADLNTSDELNLEALKAFAADQFKVSGQPSKLIVNGKIIA